MKIAIVCDDLIQNGGAERVIFDILAIYPNATLFSSVISKHYQCKLKDLNIKYQTSFLQNFLFVNKLYRFYSVFYLHYIAFLNFDFSDFDLVISLSARYSHIINTKPNTFHVAYIHTPPRMIWNTFDYFKYEKLKFFRPLINLFLFIARITDFIYFQKINLVLANSQNARSRIIKIYHKNAQVINPGIDLSIYNGIYLQKDYFLVICRLVPWKRVDLIIETFKRCFDLKLKIIGDGPEFNRLKLLADNYENIEFLGYLSEEQKIEFLLNCKAVIQIHEEDFGLVPVEALACGVPVIAYNKGGVLEVIHNYKTGILFDDQSVQGLTKALNTFKNVKFNKNFLKSEANKFNLQNFKDIFKNTIQKQINKI